MWFFCPELLRWNTSDAVMFRTVSRAVQPAKHVPVELLDTDKFTTTQEVVLYIFDYVLNLPLALGIGLAAKDRLETMFTYQDAEATGKKKVTQIFFNQKHFVLIIHYFLRNT